MSKKSPLILPGSRMQHQAARDQHIISRFYLDKFADGQRFLTAYAPGRKPRRKSTKSLTVERDFFEYSINGESTGNQYENWFQRIETAAAVLYATIHAGSGCAFRNQEEAWAEFVATLFLRSRKVREQFGPKLLEMIESEQFFGEDEIREMQVELLKQGQFVYAEDLRAKVEQVKKEMRSPAFTHLAGIEENARIIAGNILDKRWFVLEAAQGTTFVTSDCPVLTASVAPGRPWIAGNGFKHSNTAVILPLSPSRVFFAGPQNVVWKSYILSACDTREFNMLAVQFAHKGVYALESELEIQSLVDREMNTVTYGGNAFIPNKN